MYSQPRVKRSGTLGYESPNFSLALEWRCPARYIALSGLANFLCPRTQHSASLHAGLRVLRRSAAQGRPYFPVC
jgi:hypothetical protein